MATPDLFILKTPPKVFFPSFSLSKSQNLKLNPKPKYLAFLSPLYQKTVKCSAIQNSISYDSDHRAIHPKPQEIPWNKDLANSVNLIGLVGVPVQIKQLSSGKVLAWTRLAVKKSASETTWVNLSFWDELAHIAFQYVVKGQQVHVAGRLVSDTVEGDAEKQQVYYKVVVQKLNLIERSTPSVSSYNAEANTSSFGGKSQNYAGSSAGSPEELWQAFFANPIEWWDNRRDKRNPKYPDFKHKDTGEALWIEGRFNPPWVKSQLAILDSRMASMQANESSSNPSMHTDDLTSFY